MKARSLLVCVLVLGGLAALAAADQEAAPTYHGYLVGAGDSLRVEAFQHAEISGEFLVEMSGQITFPLLGSVSVAGKTTHQIALLLETMLEKDYYVDVQLQVEVSDYRSQSVTILGEVQRPGTYYLEGHTTLTQIISEAGGIRASAGPSLELRRAVIVDGEPSQKVFTFSTEKLHRGEEGIDVEVYQGDVISVPGKQLYFVTGEVARPGQYEISSGMSLMQAISQAGGLGKFASQTVEVHRDVNGEKQLLTVDLSDIRKNREDDPTIMAGDTIIVRKRFF